VVSLHWERNRCGPQCAGFGHIGVCAAAGRRIYLLDGLVWCMMAVLCGVYYGVQDVFKIPQHVGWIVVLRTIRCYALTCDLSVFERDERRVKFRPTPSELIRALGSSGVSGKLGAW